MALTQKESNDLMNDFAFRGRIKVCALTYAQYLQNQVGQPESIPAFKTKLKWSTDARQNPEQAALTLHPLVVMDPGVQQSGDKIDDPGLQASVQAVVDSLF